jgi:hypothetical protein
MLRKILTKFKIINDCIKTCDHEKSPYCIALSIECARRGKFKNGLAFAGQNAYRVNEIVSVKELINSLKLEYSLPMPDSLRYEGARILLKILNPTLWIPAMTYRYQTHDFFVIP